MQNPKTEITVVTGRQVFRNSHHISESEKLHKAVFHDYSKPSSTPASKILAKLSDSNIAERIAAKNHCLPQCYRGENLYSFLLEKSGKIHAIREPARTLNLSLGDIVSFGDDLNDMEMLQTCGTGVAVSNALIEVKTSQMPSRCPMTKTVSHIGPSGIAGF